MGTLVLRNKYGEIVAGFPCLRKSKYGTGEFYSGDKRRPRPDYKYWIKNGDDAGYDITRIDNDGSYVIEVELPYGTKLIRYGSATGRYTAPKGTNFEELSLPWDEHTCEYHEYTVVADCIKVKCVVTKGNVAPGFEQIGGGIQYVHKFTILQSIAKGLLEEVALWE